MNIVPLCTVMLAATLPWANICAENHLVVDTSRPGVEIPATMYGIFFEDINFAADGGLYGEMVKNRSFEFPQHLMGWHTFGNVSLMDDGPFDRNPHYVRLSPPSHRAKHTGLENEGFFGMGVHRGHEYRFSVWARTNGSPATLKVVLENPASSSSTQNIASASISVNSAEWTRYTAILRPDTTEAKARLRIFLDSRDATVDLEHISLFPADTWKGRTNGMRRDLAQRLADLHPGVFRFPGGCIVEGTESADRYQWKNTVGPVENRPTNISRWQFTFTDRFFPDYYQSGGLGFYEYFLLAEDIGAEPLPVISAGLVCQYQNKNPETHVPLDSLEPYICDAIDLVEFANGDTTTTWGALRAEMGHPAPFGLKYLAIGNEQWGPEYVERLNAFVTAMRKAHPEIKLVGSSGPKPDGDKFDYLWPEMRRLGLDLVDEHFYCSDEWFLSQGLRYDDYPRKGPKVFAGEYACHVKGKKWNHFYPAILEAAFMTGMERNADIVEMATYAPLLAHIEGWQWRPDMIWFDNLHSTVTSSYLVQQMFATNKGNRTVPVTIGGKPVAGTDGQNGLFASASCDETSGDYILKIVNTSGTPQPATVRLKGLKKASIISAGELTLSPPSAGISDDGTAIPDLDAENTIGSPLLITPVHHTVTPSSSTTIDVTIPPYSFSICRIRVAHRQ